MKLVIPIFLLFIFTGCGTKVAVPTKFKLNTPTDLYQISNESSKCKDESLKIMQSFSSSMLMSKEMYYVVDSNKVYPYSAAQWAITPNRIVSDEYFKMLRDLNLFSSVGNSKSRTNTSWLLETKLEDFMQYYENDNSSSYVIVSINLTILDSQKSEVISTKLFKSKMVVDIVDASGGVVALNKALSDVLSQSALWLNETCK